MEPRAKRKALKVLFLVNSRMFKTPLTAIARWLSRTAPELNHLCRHTAVMLIAALQVRQAVQDRYRSVRRV